LDICQRDFGGDSTSPVTAFIAQVTQFVSGDFPETVCLSGAFWLIHHYKRR
jgi:hypothetical protein